jgi:colicin import membrane protein
MDLDINPDIRRRIFSAADHLYEQDGRTSFPNVDSVRRAAKVDMNAASAVMRQWRRQQGAKPVLLQTVVPDEIQKASLAGLEHLWVVAQDLSNQNLRTAQAGWELERTENELLCQQLSTAFDTQAQLTADLQRSSDETQERLAAAEARCVDMASELMDRSAHTAEATARAMATEARAEGAEQRVSDLKRELEHLHDEHRGCHEKEEKTRRRHETEVQRISSEFEKQLAGAQARAAGLALELAENSRRLAEANTIAGTLQARINELERRASDLQGEVDLWRDEHRRCTEKEERARLRHESAFEKLRGELQSALGQAHASSIELAKSQEEVRGLQQRINDATARQHEHAAAPLVELDNQQSLAPSSKQKRKPTESNGEQG